jgi:hypothetical protein
LTEQEKLSREKIFFYTKITDSDFQWAFLRLLTTYRKEGDLDYKLKSRINLFHAGYQSVVISDVWSINNNKLYYQISIFLVVNEGESIALEFFKI